MSAENFAVLEGKIQAAIADYSRIFPPPYALAPNLQLASEALAALGEERRELREALRAKGLPENADLATLIHQHRSDAALAAAFDLMAKDSLTSSPFDPRDVKLANGGDELLLWIYLQGEADGSYYAELKEATYGSTSSVTGQTIPEVVLKAISWAGVEGFRLDGNISLAQVRKVLKSASSTVDFDFEVRIYSDF